jgi:phytoene desaturase
VVIGSGFGGLAAAIRLGARGFRVTVLERLDAPGGRAYVFRQDGYTFDAGPTIVTAPFLFEELWALCGKKLSDDVDLRLMDPFYRIRFDDGRTFDYCGDRDRVRAEVAKFNPADVAGYDRFMKASEGVFNVGFDGLSRVPFDTFTDMIKVAPDMVRHRSYRSVCTFAAEYLSDPALRTVFSFHPLLIGGNPYAVTSVYSLISFLEQRFGIHFAMGGTGSLIKGMVGLIEGQGNVIRTKAHVEKILVEGARAVGVRLAGGEEIRADLVVSNADSATTYNRLLADERKFRWTDERLEQCSSSMSLFVWHFGTKRRYDDVAHHTIMMGPRYRGLLHDIFDKKILAEDFSLYLYRPTATDPSMAPEGCDSFYVLSPVPNLDGATDWATEAEPYRARIARYLSETILPGLESSIATSRIVTPIDFRDRLCSYRGAAFGMEPILLQSAWFRPHNRSEDFERLYLVGAGTHPGAGLPGVLSSAEVVDKMVPDAASFL